MSAVADHLWQSTWFVAAVWVLAFLVRNDAARVRHWVWLAASVKFIVPFALLGWVGRQFIFQVEDERALLPIVQHVAKPLTEASIAVGQLSHATQSWLIGIWIAGSSLLLGRWLCNWLRSRALVRSSLPCEIRAPIPARCSDRLAAPAVVGIVDPVLLVPCNLPSNLTPAHVDAIVAHEMWHVRRGDNATAALHALVEALFWFHPLVWLIGARLVDERERACDEGVIHDGSGRSTYAEALLRVCRYSVESRLLCTASAMGGDLSARIRSIMSELPKSRCRGVRRILLAAALVGCAALPIASGMTVVATSSVAVAAGTRSIRVSAPAGPTYVVLRDDYVYGRNVSLRELIARAYGVRARDVLGHAPWLDHPRYDVELRAAVRNSHAYRRLVADLLDRQFNVELIMRPTPRLAE